ncbi:MAG: glycosyltransferase family 39 protein [Lachnospiraceae bacterium]|nr:glycosyltransferase family 39 protein [Lachnospiraceae bacterium]
MRKLLRSDHLPYILAFLCSLVYISLTFNDNVWLDEAFTATLIKTDYRGVLDRSMNDTLPPLYNLLLKLSTDIFGYRVPVMKLTSAFFMMLAMFLSVRPLQKRFGNLTACIFTLSLTFMPSMMFFGVEIRMYSLGFFFATLCGIYAWELICDPCIKNGILFVLFSVLAGYSHHFAFVTAGFVYLWLLLYYIFFDRKKIKCWVYILLATALLYFPCLLVTLGQLKSVSGYFSMPEVTIPVFIKYMRYPYTTGFTPLSIILSLYVLFLFVKLLIKKEKTLQDLFSLSCFLTYYGVLVFGTIVSKIMTANIFVDRYLFFSMGLLWLFVSIQSASLPKKYGYIFLVTEVFIGCIGYCNAYNSEYRGDPHRLISYLKENVNEGDILYTIEDAEGLALCLPFYDDRLRNIEDIGDVEREKADHTVWVAILDGYDPDSAEKELDDNTLIPKGDFSFDRYDLKLYVME